jgi:hypothetical protein
MSTKHTVRQGECLSSIAAKYGFSDFRTIYNHPENADFKSKRPNPNLIYPGDIVSIPEPTAKAATCATGKSHRFKLKLPRALLRLEVQLEEPHHYELLVGGETFPGTTDGKSPIEHRIPPLAAEGRLELWPATEGNEEAREGAFFWDLAIGHLDPIEMLSGVQGRLANLGYYSGPIDGRDSPDLSLAIASFESDMELTVTGKADGEALQNKLREVHDGG